MKNILQYKNIIIIGGDGTYNEVIIGILQREDNYRPMPTLYQQVLEIL